MTNPSTPPPGYYVERIKSKVGTGDTAKAAKMENFWLLIGQEGEAVRMELLDIHEERSGFVELVALEDFWGRFQHQPEFVPKKLSVGQRQADRLAARAERHLAENELLSAEFEFNKAIKLDEENVRANFGLGKTYLALGEPEKATQVFRKLSTVEAVLEPENKHIFNEFGIQLRKMGLYAEAARHYTRAINLAPRDENLWFNLGRALFEGGQRERGLGAIKKALEMNPGLEEARKYLAAVQAQNA
ncbi:MAG: tetratricopeptide repeat protein [Thermodesulfobacteriota bacterium]